MASPSDSGSTFLCKRRSARAPFLLCLSAVFWLHAGDALQRFEFSRPEMGSMCRIMLYAASEAAAKTASDAAFARVEALNRVCSDYLTDSELIGLCRAGSAPVSDDLLAVIERSQSIEQMTDGAFDISVGHLTNLWRRSKRKGALPSPEQLAKALSLTGWQHIQVNAKEKRVSLAMPGMQLDLGGIAKGFAADAALRVLASHGIRRAVVAASGDLAIGDAPPGEQGWEAGLRTFEAPEASDKLLKLRLQNCAVSTSGDLHQAVEIGGVRYSHIVDPKTGLGLTRRIACSVIAPDATTSDALATAMCVLGADAGIAVLKSHPDIHARFAEPSANGGVKTTTTAHFPTTAP